jgi:hypothetical protein
MATGQLHLILDKSSFQEMPSSAFVPLDRHFELVIPPILVKEILGDLAKGVNVRNLADRFAVNTTVLPPYEFMVAQSLLGAQIPMDGRIIPKGLMPVKAADGKLGHIIVDTSEDHSIQRWQQGRFTLEDALFAYKWQRVKRFINKSHYISKLTTAGYDVRCPKNLDDLRRMVDEIIADPTLQGTLLGLLLSEFKPTHAQQVAILNRWNAEKKPLMTEFATYATHCLRANLMLSLGNQKADILGTPHEHDLRDLEYLYYLPFCEVFASRDKIHEKLKTLLRDDQTFVGKELATDLKRLAEEWNAFSKEEKAERHQTYGSRPPEHENSIVYKLWQKHRPDPKSGIPLPLGIIDMPLVDTATGRELTLGALLKEFADKVTQAEATGEAVDDGLFLKRSKKVSRQKLEELFPHIDFDSVDTNEE